MWTMVPQVSNTIAKSAYFRLNRDFGSTIQFHFRFDGEPSRSRSLLTAWGISFSMIPPKPRMNP